MSRDVITVGSTMWIPLLYRGKYSKWRERFMNYLEEQTDGKAMINSIHDGDQPLPVTAEEKKTQKIDRLARSLLIQGLPNDIYSLIDSNETAKDLWDALERQMRGSEYVINDLKKCGYKKDNCDVNDALGYKKKAVVVTSDPLALVAEKTKVSKRKEKVEVQTESEGSADEDISDLKKIAALLAKAFNRKKYYAKPINNNLRTSSANKKPEYVKLVEKKEDKKADEKKMDMSKLKCYNCKKEGHFAKDCKKAKTAEEKKTQKIDRLARSLLIQGLPNDIYSLIDSNETAKDLWDALERQMRGSEYGEQDRKSAILYKYETFKATEGEQLLDTYLH
nr:hypothetical protein [Tanacetum cinerariifolium]